MAPEATQAEQPEDEHQWGSMYAGGAEPFGSEPFTELQEHLRALCSGRTVLDLGAGYGRDSLWLARNCGCAVTAVEPSVEVISHLHATVSKTTTTTTTATTAAATTEMP